MLLPIPENVLYRVNNWRAGGSSDPTPDVPNSIEEVESMADANVISSRAKDFITRLSDDGTKLDSVELHSVVLDIDVPATLIQSSTPGKHHLYIEVLAPWDDYVNLLDAMQKVGILEPGYVSASKERGFTAVRLPWVRK